MANKRRRKLDRLKCTVGLLPRINRLLGRIPSYQKRKRTRVDHTISNSMEETELDRLSMLPDSLISHILSLIKDTKFAIQTCVLSKRWRNLWTHLPSLYFNSESFKQANDSIPPYEKFGKFLSLIMEKRKPYKIQTLSFSNSISTNFLLPCRSLHPFLAYAAKQGVEELETDTYAYFLRECLTSLNKLNSLKINGARCNINLNLPDYPTEFGLLTRFHLENVDITNNGGDHLFSTCVNLEELSLVKCRFINRSSSLTISCPRLSSLTISKNYYSAVKELVISSPRLLKLELEDLREKLVVDESIVIKNVDIRYESYFGKPEFKFKLQRFYQEVVKNVIPKSKSAVLECEGWKWEFMKCNKFVIIKTYSCSSKQSVLTIRLECDWDKVDFVEVFGELVFVRIPVIMFVFGSCKSTLGDKLCAAGAFPDLYDNEIWKNYCDDQIMQELHFIDEVVSKEVKFVSEDWKLRVIRTLDSKVMLEKEWGQIEATKS